MQVYVVPMLLCPSMRQKPIHTQAATMVSTEPGTLKQAAVPCRR